MSNLFTNTTLSIRKRSFGVFRFSAFLDRVARGAASPAGARGSRRGGFELRAVLDGVAWLAAVEAEEFQQFELFTTFAFGFGGAFLLYRGCCPVVGGLVRGLTGVRVRVGFGSVSDALVLCGQFRVRVLLLRFFFRFIWCRCHFYYVNVIDFARES